MKIKSFILFLFLFCFQLSDAQNAILNFNPTACPDKNVEPFLKSKSFKNEAKVHEHIKLTLQLLYQKGYLLASIDSITKDSLTTNVYLFIGEKYHWATLKPGNIPKEILKKSSIKNKTFLNKPLSSIKFEIAMNAILSTLENNGYPFASIKLDSISFNESMITASLLLDKKKGIVIDSVIIKGNAKINPVYLYNYLNIKPNDFYNEKLIREIEIKLKEIPFLNSTNQPEVLFLENMTKLTIFANKKKASKFNGIIGFLPNQVTGKVLVTGDIALLLNNELGRGEKIDLNWRKLQNNITDLKSAANYPFILNTPFGLEGTFYLYRRDTLYQDINSKIDVQYILPGANHVGLFFENKTSRLISTAAYQNTNKLPSTLDFTKHIYGININKSKLDYKYNPKKGYSINASGGIGNRKTIKNPDLKNELYDALDTNETQYNIVADVNFFIPVGESATINVGLKGARLESSSIFLNEQYRIGGLKMLRGFDEESIFASTYSIVTVEYRYLLEQNSYAHLFVDAAYYENKSVSGFNNDFPFGFGLGLSFETKAGIFSLAYALGYQHGELAPLRSAKIHFGFINYF